MLDAERLREWGVDADLGLAYCAEDPEFYEEMLGEYAREGEQKAEELTRFFDARDWDAYRIRAHSVKSTSRMIGAAALSDMARAMEDAAKAGNEALLLSAHGPFMAQYTQLVSRLRGLTE